MERNLGLTCDDELICAMAGEISTPEKTLLLACRNLASEKAELAEMVQQLEGKLTVADAHSKEAAKAMKQLQDEFEASHTHRSAFSSS